jgi:hypothetical protein
MVGILEKENVPAMLVDRDLHRGFNKKKAAKIGVRGERPPLGRNDAA